MDIDPASVPREQIPALIAALAARLLAEPAPAPVEASPTDDSDRLLTTREAAELLGHSTKWVYRHVAKLPFARRLGPRDFRFSLAGLRKWQARQRVDAAR